MATKRAILVAIGAGLVGWWPLGAAGVPAGAGVASAQQPASAEPQAEEDDPMVREMMVMSIPRESAGYYADLMGLDDLQREVIMEMHRDYLEKYRDAAVAMRDARVAIDEKLAGGGGGDMEDMEATMRDLMRVGLGFMDRVMSLGQQYVDDLGALAADEDQQAGHERVVRAREREMAVVMSNMDGSGDGGGGGVVDLIALGRQMDPPLLPAENEDPAARVLLEYERELGALCGPFVDRALAAFREMAEAVSLEGPDAFTNERLEAEMEAVVEQFSAINERTVRRVHGALTAERRDAWDLAYKRARWPRVYAPNDFHRTHDAARALEGLTDDQRGLFQAAMAQYSREAEPANKKWIDAIAEAETAQNAMSNEWSDALWAEYQAKDQASKDAQAAREALDARFAERILTALTPEQRETMPKREAGVDADEVIRQMGGG